LRSSLVSSPGISTAINRIFNCAAIPKFYDHLGQVIFVQKNVFLFGAHCAPNTLLVHLGLRCKICFPAEPSSFFSFFVRLGIADGQWPKA
jgi:hypothetical protein